MILNTYLLFIAILSALYCCIQFLYKINWHKIKPYEFQTQMDFPTVSIIVAARNESENIALLLEKLLAQDYPKELFEIIIVDDHSEDNTTQIIQSFFPIAASKNIKLKLLYLKDFVPDRSKVNAFKKKAIAYALSQSQQEWIVCTDADCYMNEKWLSYLMNAAHKTKAKAVLAPVVFEEGDKAISLNLRRFQQLDLLAMMVVTAIGVKWKAHLANGANFAYERKTYESVNGFEGQEHLASGDDMLLLQKIAKQKDNYITFLKSKEAIVYTKLKSTWRELWLQRLRWASKSTAYKEIKLWLVMGLVGLFNMSIFINILLCFFFFEKGVLCFAVVFQLLAKLFIDYQVLKSSAQFFDRTKWLKSFTTVSFLHWVYMIAIGFSALFKKEYIWKGRKVH